MLSPLRSRLRSWLFTRHASTDNPQLSHRQIFIVPTAAGWWFGITLATLLLASINYQLNLGYALTFLLSGAALVSMHVTHRTLHGLTLCLRPMEPSFAKHPATLSVALECFSDNNRYRYGVGLRPSHADDQAMVWTNVPTNTVAHVSLGFIPALRGQYPVPDLRIETRFPFGLFKAWALWRPSMQVLVYPEPEKLPPPLPQGQFGTQGSVWASASCDPDTHGVRAYRRGDPLKSIVWKKAAQAMASGTELVCRESRPLTTLSLWLDWHDCAGMHTEDRLSRLCAWVVFAHQQGASFGMRLPQQQLALGNGEAHRTAALRILALWA